MQVKLDHKSLKAGDIIYSSSVSSIMGTIFPTSASPSKEKLFTLAVGPNASSQKSSVSIDDG